MKIKLNKSEKIIAKEIRQTLIEVFGLTKKEAKDRILRHLGQTVGNTDPKFWNFVFLYQNPYVTTFKLSGLPNDKPVGSCIYEETSEFEWYLSIYDKIEEIEERIYAENDR